MESSSERQNIEEEITTTFITEDPEAVQTGNGTILKLMMAFKIFFCVVIIINNIIILSSIRHWKSLSKTSRLLISHLAYSDLLSGVGIIIRTITIAVYGLFRFSCIIPMGLAAMSGSSSVTGVLFLSIEAFFSARANNVYLSKKTYQRAVVGVTVSWLFHLIFVIAGILTSVPAFDVRVCYFGNPYYIGPYLIAFSAMLILHLPVVLGLQISTLRTVSTRLGNIMGSNVATMGSSAGAESSEPEPSTAALTPAVTAKRLMVIKKLTILSILCGIIFMISWGPYAFILFLASTAPADRPEAITPSYLINLGTMTTINSVANIYIYLARSKEFRQGVRESFGCYFVVSAS